MRISRKNIAGGMLLAIGLSVFGYVLLADYGYVPRHQFFFENVVDPAQEHELTWIGTRIVLLSFVALLVGWGLAFSRNPTK